MSNNRATGEGFIAVELLKHSPSIVKETIANMYNTIFEEHSKTMGIGDSILTPIPKPGKTEGPRKNLRPINILNVVRKALPLITLMRIEARVNGYISNRQSA